MSVGQPGTILLDEFGSLIWDAFGQPPFLVGSALTEKTGWRDVDVRLILDDEEYYAAGFSDPKAELNGKSRSFHLAFSLLGQKITGLPIDFQVQPRSWANETFNGNRSAIGLVPARKKPPCQSCEQGSRQPQDSGEEEGMKGWRVFEPRQITGRPAYYYGYIGRNRPERHCCKRGIHRGVGAARRCSELALRQLRRSA